MRGVIVAVAFLAAWPGAQARTPGSRGGALPPVLDSFLTDEAHGTAADRQALLAGDPVVKLLDADPTREVAVFGVVWVNASAAAYIEQVKRIEEFERGNGFHVTKRVSDPPHVADFARMELPEQDFKELKDCKVGDCSLKMDAYAIRTLRSEVDWTKPTARADATALFRRLALAYVTGYREGGNSRLAVYRDKERPTFVENEFRSMIDRLPRLATGLPNLKRFLLDYPQARLENATDFLYWQEVQFGLKPTVRISHMVIQELPEATVIASKMLYASHYFWTALEIRVLLPDAARGAGFWLVTVNRSRSDGLAGFTGRVVGSRVRSEVEDGARAALAATKARLEKQ